MTRPRIAIVASHPIQYHAPWFRALDTISDLDVFFAHRQTPQQQAGAGYGVQFDWDVDVLSGYRSEFLDNLSNAPSVDRFNGCDTPGVGARILERQRDAVVVLGWNLKSYWQAARASRRAGTPVLVRGDSQLNTPRPLWLRIAKKLAYPHRLRAFDGFLPVGLRSREYLLHYGVSQSRCTICPHTIDVHRFGDDARRASEAVRRMRSELGLASGVRVALFVGRLLDWKRPADVIRAISLSRTRDMACAFVGAGSSSDELARLAAELGVRAIFAGFRNQSELPRWYALADVLVLPSTGRETWGLVANESLASGTPVIASDQVGCAPDFARLGDCFRTYPCGKSDALARLLDEVPEKNEAIGSACRDAASRFAPAVAARAVCEALASR
jgi:glycosyltransferase involved in cell wall biosynthesis